MTTLFNDYKNLNVQSELEDKFFSLIEIESNLTEKEKSQISVDVDCESDGSLSFSFKTGCRHGVAKFKNNVLSVSINAELKLVSFDFGDDIANDEVALVAIIHLLELRDEKQWGAIE